MKLIALLLSSVASVTLAIHQGNDGYELLVATLFYMLAALAIESIRIFHRYLPKNLPLRGVVYSATTGLIFVLCGASLGLVISPEKSFQLQHSHEAQWPLILLLARLASYRSSTALPQKQSSLPPLNSCRCFTPSGLC